MTDVSCAGSTISTMPKPQLNVFNISACSMPPCAINHSNTGGRSPVLRSMELPCPSSKARGIFSLSPPPVGSPEERYFGVREWAVDSSEAEKLWSVTEEMLSKI